MGIDSISALYEAMHKHRLLEAEQFAQLSGLAARFNDPRMLARDLVGRGWLTPYQVNQLFQGNARDLVLGHYVLLERLGEGGMGQVFKARHQKLGRVVALKVIRKEKLADAGAVQRFRREIQAAAQLEHPNVVGAIDADEAEDALYFIMEYVEGIDLGRLVKEKGPLPVAPACEYLRQAALGLQHAHERGYVHRDVKPSNLLLTTNGGRSRGAPVIKLLDLGLARLRNPGGEEASSLTQMGVVVGTPDYMAPEQARNSSRADIRSDLYSLGCTFYYLLTGRPPFTGETATEKLMKHCFDEPLPVEQLRPEVPPRVGKIVQKLMAKEPADRYPTPAKLVVALSRPGLLSTGPIKPLTKFLLGVLGKGPAIRADAPERLRKAADRRRGLQRALLGGAFAAVLVVALLIIMFAARSGGTTPTPNTSAGGVRLPADQLDPRAIPAEERFAWQPKELVAVLGKHRGRPWGQVTCLAVSANGRLIATGSSDGLVSLWDASTLIEQADWREDPISGVYALAFSPDNQALAYGCADGTIYLWDLSKPRPARKAVLKGHLGTVWALAWGPGGSVLASGSGDGSLRLWDPTRGDKAEVLNQPKADDIAVLAVAFAPGGQVLASGGRDRKVHIWDLAGGKLTERFALQGSQDDISELAFAAKGDRLLSTGTGRFLRIWDLAKGEQLGNPIELTPKGGGPYATAAISTDGQMVAVVAGQSAPVRLWEITGESARDRGGLGNLSYGTAALCFFPDGKAVVAAGSRRLQVWSVVRKPKLAVGSDEPVQVRSVALSPDGRTLATGSYNGPVRLWDLGGPEPVGVHPLDGHVPRAVAAVRFSPDGTLLASASQDFSARVWDLTGQQPAELARLTGFNNALIGASFSSDNKLFACGSYDRTARLYDIVFGKFVQRGDPLVHPDHLASLALARDGRLLACLVGDQPLRGQLLRLWDLAGPKPVVRSDIRLGKLTISAFDLAPDGQTLALGTGTTTLRMYDISKPEAKEKGEWPLLPARGSIHALAFAPDGQSLAASYPGRLVVVDPVGKKVLHEWHLPGTAEDLAFGPEGRYLATANGNGTVYLLRLKEPAAP
jgi:WD40 repeat protein/serine/threonine protein kinase